jgi:hypothetical protein
MNNADEILKKILLNMKYDSSKSLNENKRMLSEECISKDTTLNNRVVGNLRSDEYPELGKWGDGSCLCSEEKCLKYDKSCCKKSSVEVGDVEKVSPPNEESSEIAGIDYNGNSITLPADAVITRKYENFKYKSYTDDYGLSVKAFPSIKRYCDLSIKIGGNIEKCVLDGVKNLFSKISEGAILSFTYNGLSYEICYTKNKENPLDLKITGYYGLSPKDKSSIEIGKCKGTPWIPLKDDKKGDGKTGGSSVAIYDKKKKMDSYNGEKGNEILLPLIK